MNTASIEGIEELRHCGYPHPPPCHHLSLDHLVHRSSSCAREREYAQELAGYIYPNFSIGIFVGASRCIAWGNVIPSIAFDFVLCSNIASFQEGDEQFQPHVTTQKDLQAESWPNETLAT